MRRPLLSHLKRVVVPLQRLSQAAAPHSTSSRQPADQAYPIRYAVPPSATHSWYSSGSMSQSSIVL